MDPAGQSYPATQGVHVVASAAEYVPAGHFVIRPFTQEYPAGHGLLPDPEPLVEVLPY